MAVEIFDDFLTDQEWAQALMELDGHVWSPGFHSNDKSKWIWGAPLSPKGKIHSNLVHALLEQTGMGFTTLYAGANAQTVDRQATLHMDSGGGATHTLVWFSHRHWLPHWGGRLNIYPGISAGAPSEYWITNWAIEPKPNRAVLFYSTIPHVGEPPNSAAMDIVRVSVGLHLKHESGDDILGMRTPARKEKREDEHLPKGKELVG